MREKAMEFLERNPLEHVDMLEPIRRGTAEVLAIDAEGVLVFETDAQLYMLTTETPASTMRLIAKIDNADLVAVHQGHAVPVLARKYSLHQTMCCYQAVWPHTYPPKISSSNITIAPLSPDMAERITALYSHNIGIDYIRERLSAREMFGAFNKGELAGFIGLHKEGSMGMLEIDPSFRRKGIGLQLVSYLCAYQLSRGRIPFSQFVRENNASRQLHERLGFSISDSPVFWLE